MPSMVPRIFVAWLLVAPAGMSAQDQAAPRVDVRNVAVVTGRIDRIDPFTRSVNLRTAEGLLHSVFVGPELKIFDELRAGDAVTVRITESVVVALRPNAKTTAVEDSTAAANKGARGAQADVLQQLKATRDRRERGRGDRDDHVQRRGQSQRDADGVRSPPHRRLEAWRHHRGHLHS